MRIRISFTINVSDDMRKAIAHYYGEPGKASRKLLQTHFYQYGHNMHDDLMYEWVVDKKQAEEKGELTEK